MPEANAGFAAHQGDNPNEHAGQPRVAHAGVQREAGDGLKYKSEECEEVDEPRQRIVTCRDGTVQFCFEYVGLDDIDDLLTLRTLQRKESVPPRVLIADESPIETREKIEHIDERANEMDETHPTEPILLVGFRGIEGADGCADEIAGHAESHQSNGVDPVIDTDREFPHVHAPILNRVWDGCCDPCVCDSVGSAHSPHSNETW